MISIGSESLALLWVFKLYVQNLLVPLFDTFGVDRVFEKMQGQKRRRKRGFLVFIKLTSLDDRTRPQQCITLVPEPRDTSAGSETPEMLWAFGMQVRA